MFANEERISVGILCFHIPESAINIHAATYDEFLSTFRNKRLPLLTMLWFMFGQIMINMRRFSVFYFHFVFA